MSHLSLVRGATVDILCIEDQIISSQARLSNIQEDVCRALATCSAAITEYKNCPNWHRQVKHPVSCEEAETGSNTARSVRCRKLQVASDQACSPLTRSIGAWGHRLSYESHWYCWMMRPTARNRQRMGLIVERKHCSQRRRRYYVRLDWKVARVLYYLFPVDVFQTLLLSSLVPRLVYYAYAAV